MIKGESRQHSTVHSTHNLRGGWCSSTHDLLWTSSNHAAYKYESRTKQQPHANLPYLRVCTCIFSNKGTVTRDLLPSRLKYFLKNYELLSYIRAFQKLPRVLDTAESSSQMSVLDTDRPVKIVEIIVWITQRNNATKITYIFGLV